jgi:hypothetical protein
MGPKVPRIAESIAVAIVIPTRNVVWVANSPRKDARAIFHISPLSIFSLGINRDMIQNAADAPIALSVKSTKGDTASELAMSLHSTTFSPNMVYAAATEICPLKESVAIAGANLLFLPHKSNLYCV